MEAYLLMHVTVLSVLRPITSCLHAFSFIKSETITVTARWASGSNINNDDNNDLIGWIIGGIKEHLQAFCAIYLTMRCQDFSPPPFPVIFPAWIRGLIIENSVF